MAIAGVTALRELGASTVAVTARGSYREDRGAVLRDVGVWAETNAIVFDDVHIGRPKTGAGCDMYVDDSPDDVAALRDAGQVAVVFDQPWNSALAPPRAAGWAQLADVLVGQLR